MIAIPESRAALNRTTLDCAEAQQSICECDVPLPFDVKPIPHPDWPHKRTVWIMMRDGREILGKHGRRFYGSKRAALMALDDHVSRQDHDNG